MNLSAQHELEHSLDVLAVNHDSSWNDVEKQYRQLIQQWHPDRNSGDDQDLAQTKFIEINTAFKHIRAHYRKNGSVPRRMPPEQDGPLLGTKKKVAIQPALYKNKFLIASVFAFCIVATFGAILWSLDSRLAENNRDRAKAGEAELLAEDELLAEEVLPAKDASIKAHSPIQQSSNGLED